MRRTMLPAATPAQSAPAAMNDIESSPPSADPASTDAAPRQRPIRSFVVRAGRLGPGQQRALNDLGPRFVLPFQAAPLDLAAAFGRQAPTLLEIGFGMGDATAAVAAAMPGHNLLGVEVHEPGIGALLKLIGERGLTNLRIVRHDAVEVLAQMLAPASLDRVHVWFPDPWHKARHHKRRLIQPPLVRLLASRLQPGGVVHCATDWQPYAEQMLAVLAAEPALANTAPAESTGYVDRPAWRPQTRFEARGLRLGHGVWDLVFVKRSS
jgi:tRNA (guanine-N7-)-methyltransferase